MPKIGGLALVVAALALLAAPAHATAGCDCCSGGLDLFSFETGIATGFGGRLHNFRCSNVASAACADDSDCDFRRV